MTYYMRLSTTYLSTPSLVYEGESVLPKLEDEADVLVDASARREVRTRSFGFAAWYTVLTRRSLRS